MNTQATIDFGRANRDRGIERAMSHAEAERRGWKEMAFDFLVNVYIKHHRGPFMCEDYRAACQGVVPDPPSLRSFGGIILKAAKRGLIKQIGVKKVKNPRAQMANAAVWQRI